MKKLFIIILIISFAVAAIFLFPKISDIRSLQKKIVIPAQKAPGAFEDARQLAVAKGKWKEIIKGVHAFVYETSEKQSIRCTIIYVLPGQIKKKDERRACHMVTIEAERSGFSVGIRYCMDHKQYQIDEGFGYESKDKELVLKAAKMLMNLLNENAYELNEIGNENLSS